MAWELKRERYLTLEEVRQLRASTEALALADLAKGRTTWPRNWMLIDLASQTGLRVSELVAVRIRDLELSGKTPCLWVRGSKNRKASEGEPVSLSRALVKHLKEFIAWRQDLGENVKSDGHLLTSSRGGAFSVRAAQTIFKRACKEAGLRGGGKHGYSIHALRHTWATYLYQKTKNLRLVMKELRHRNIGTTTIYTDITPEERAESVNNVYDDID